MALPSSPFVFSSVGAGAEPARMICRGVRRMLLDRGYAGVTEFTLANGRRADILAVDNGGGIVIVEIKSGIADFRSDGKWHEYLEFCDAFYFAVDGDFPQEMIPPDCGLIVADGYGAEIAREAPVVKLNPARRKALVLRVALVAAQRLHKVEDPGLGRGWHS